MSDAAFIAQPPSTATAAHARGSGPSARAAVSPVGDGRGAATMNRERRSAIRGLCGVALRQTRNSRSCAVNRGSAVADEDGAPQISSTGVLGRIEAVGTSLWPRAEPGDAPTAQPRWASITATSTRRSSRSTSNADSSVTWASRSRAAPDKHGRARRSRRYRQRARPCPCRSPSTRRCLRNLDAGDKVKDSGGPSLACHRASDEHRRRQDGSRTGADRTPAVESATRERPPRAPRTRRPAPFQAP